MERPKFLRRFSRQSNSPEPVTPVQQLKPYQSTELVESPKEVTLLAVVDQAINNFRSPKDRPSSNHYYSLIDAATDAIKTFNMSPIAITELLIHQTQIDPESAGFNDWIRNDTFTSWDEVLKTALTLTIEAEMIKKQPDLDIAESMRYEMSYWLRQAKRKI